uniref:Uncharacterized protein n=1 Tax=Timema monikensis TaxID=170555 RepID=A0A7R9HLF1_9NEOP|nr:unnamed protein product [Timema monikensis]
MMTKGGVGGEGLERAGLLRYGPGARLGSRASARRNFWRKDVAVIRTWEAGNSCLFGTFVMVGRTASMPDSGLPSLPPFAVFSYCFQEGYWHLGVPDRASSEPLHLIVGMARKDHSYKGSRNSHLCHRGTSCVGHTSDFSESGIKSGYISLHGISADGHADKSVSLTCGLPGDEEVGRIGGVFCFINNFLLSHSANAANFPIGSRRSGALVSVDLFKQDVRLVSTPAGMDATASGRAG